MLGSVKPREQNGRDTFARYRAQIRSAAIATLELLEGKIDRVYCDVHDDYVIRYNSVDGYKYTFIQVKTKDKQSYSWNINDLFGIPVKNNKINIQNMRDSFGGKMILHTVNFPDSCAEIVFQTNITINEKSEEFVSNIVSGDFSDIKVKILFDNFNELIGESYGILSSYKIKECLSKFKVISDIQYIKNKNHRFELYAVDDIYKYSEVDLSRNEVEIILLKLLDLVSKKSEGAISNYNEDTIESEAAICIYDLLDVLSISKSAYEMFLSSGDDKAIKNVSIIQRVLSTTNANPEQVDYCSKCKISWDSWWLINRSVLPDYKLISIRDRVKKTLKNVVKFNIVDFEEMIESLEYLKIDLEYDDMLFDLNMDQLVGAFFSEIIKGMN